MKDMPVSEARLLVEAHLVLLKKIQKLVQPLITGEAAVVVASAFTTMGAMIFRHTDRDEVRWRSLCEAAWGATYEEEMKRKVGGDA